MSTSAATSVTNVAPVYPIQPSATYAPAFQATPTYAAVASLGQNVISNTATPAPIIIYTPKQLDAMRKQDLAINNFYAKLVEIREADAAATLAASQVLASAKLSAEYRQGNKEITEENYNSAQQEYNRHRATRFSMEEDIIKAKAAMDLAILEARHSLGQTLATQ